GLGYRVAGRRRSPTVVSERARGFEKSRCGARCRWKGPGPSLNRVAMTLEEPVGLPTVDLIRRVKDKLKRRIAPREVGRGKAPVFQNSLTGKKVDLDLLPIPRHWP